MDIERNGGSVVPGLVRVDDFADRLLDWQYVLMVPPDDDRAGGVELWPTHRNELAVVAYSSIELLVATCGSGQPWVTLSREDLEAFCQAGDSIVVALDLPIPEGRRYPDVDERDLPDLEPIEPASADWELVYVPTRPIRSGDQQAVVELQWHEGRRTLLAYGSLEALAAGCGPHQAWGAVYADDLEQVMAECGAEQVVFNPVLSEDARHTGPVRDWSRAERMPDIG